MAKRAIIPPAPLDAPAELSVTKVESSFMPTSWTYKPPPFSDATPPVTTDELSVAVRSDGVMLDTNTPPPRALRHDDTATPDTVARTEVVEALMETPPPCSDAVLDVIARSRVAIAVATAACTSKAVASSVPTTLPSLTYKPPPGAFHT